MSNYRALIIKAAREAGDHEYAAWLASRPIRMKRLIARGAYYGI